MLYDCSSDIQNIAFQPGRHLDLSILLEMQIVNDKNNDFPNLRYEALFNYEILDVEWAIAAPAKLL